jgi:hypothetical protein
MAFPADSPGRSWDGGGAGGLVLPRGPGGRKGRGKSHDRSGSAGKPPSRPARSESQFPGLPLLPPGIAPPAAGEWYPWQCWPLPTTHRQLKVHGWNLFTLYEVCDIIPPILRRYLIKPGDNLRLLSLLFNISILICQYFLLYFLFYFVERNLNYVHWLIAPCIHEIRVTAIHADILPDRGW